jgi:AcrR family transcriptional regulator
MGRRAGINSEDTRRELLAAAAKVLLARGYEGTRVSEIAREAGLTTGAIYNHFASKGELLEAAIAEQAPEAFERLTDLDSAASLATALREAGSVLGKAATSIGPLVLELVVTARRDPEVAKLVQHGFATRENLAVAVTRAAQDAGEIDPELDASAITRLSTLLAMGAHVAAAAGLEPVEDARWLEVIDRMIDSVRPKPDTGAAGAEG